MFNLLYGRNILKLGSLPASPEPFCGSGTVGDVYVKYFLYNVKLPLVVTFSNAGEITTKRDLANEDYSPWGFDFVKRYDVNVISFSAIGFANWYRHKDFQNFIMKLSELLTTFNIKLGYGGSMGGYAASAYANCLGFNRQLLMNPISTLSASLAPWETRFEQGKVFDWSSGFSDGAKATANNIIVYDPLFNLDTLHAKRYCNRTELKLPGVGHGIPKHLANLGLFKSIFESFLLNKVDPLYFHKQARSRRYYDGYYKWMLSNKNTHLTPRRAEIIKLHNKLIPKSIEPALPKISDSDIDLLRDTAIKVERLNTNLAYKIMLLAYKFRPTGKVIKSCLENYKKIVNNL